MTVNRKTLLIALDELQAGDPIRYVERVPMSQFTFQPRAPVVSHQSRIDSAFEVALNILIGAAVSLAAQAVIFPLYGIHVGAAQHLGIVALFTVVSVARQYVLRRLCNGRSPYRFLKEKFR